MLTEFPVSITPLLLLAVVVLVVLIVILVVGFIDVASESRRWPSMKIETAQIRAALTLEKL